MSGPSNAPGCKLGLGQKSAEMHLSLGRRFCGLQGNVELHHRNRGIASFFSIPRMRPMPSKSSSCGLMSSPLRMRKLHTSQERLRVRHENPGKEHDAVGVGLLAREFPPET
jgi:hypothetical protein